MLSTFLYNQELCYYITNIAYICSYKSLSHAQADKYKVNQNLVATPPQTMMSIARG